MCLDGDTNKIEGVKLSLKRIQEGDEQKSGRLKTFMKMMGKFAYFLICCIFKLFVVVSI